MSHRVSVYQGKNPIIILAPHGPEERQINLIAQTAINRCNGFGIINHGWKKAQNANWRYDEADCNNITHLQQDVIKDEFLGPLLGYKSRILRKWTSAYVFNLRGSSGRMRHLAGDQALDILLGFGDGFPPSYTCETWRKNLMLYLLKRQGLTTYAAKSGSLFSGRDTTCLTQVFRHPLYYHKDVHAMQLEIVDDLRTDDEIAYLTGECLGDCFLQILNYDTWEKPKDFKVESV